MLLTAQEEGAAAGSCKNPLQITTPTGGSCYCPETDNMMECMCACGACVWSVCVSVAAEQNLGQWFSVSSAESTGPCCVGDRGNTLLFLHNRNLITHMFSYTTTETLELYSFFSFREMFMDFVSVKHQTDTQPNLQSQLSESCNSNKTMLKITIK